MLNALLSHTAASHAAEAHRHAYNAAFEELGLTWYWDAATYHRLQANGRDGVRVYLETEQAHLLRAYEADFLVEAIETTQARCYAGAGGRAHADLGGCANDSHRPALRSVTPGASSQRAATRALG